MPIGIAAAIAGLASAGLGIYQTAHASHLAKKNIRPQFNVDPAFQQNLDLSTAYAGQGLPTEVLQNYYKQSGRNLTQGIDAIIQTGQGGNAISSLYGDAQDSAGQIAAMDAMQHMKNIDAVRGDRLALADQNNQAWLINKYKPFADQSQLIAEQKTAGINNITGGLNTILGGVANQATSMLYNTRQPNPAGGDRSTPRNSTIGTIAAPRLYSNGTTTPSLTDYLSPFSKQPAPLSGNGQYNNMLFGDMNKNNDYSPYSDYQYQDGYVVPTEY